MNLQLVYPRAIMALGLPLYLKWKYVIQKNKTKQKDKKQKKESFHRLGRTPDLRVIYCPTTTTVDSR